MDKSKIKNNYKEKMYIHIIAAILFGVCIFRYNVMKNPYYTPDEVGYWAAGAWIHGIDWSPILSHAGYYGWGYGLLLAPLFFIKNTELRFQAAIIINVILLSVSYYLLISITKKILKNYDYIKCTLIAGVTILYSYHIAYAHLSMCEVYLTFLFILSIKCIVDICENATYFNITSFAFVIGLQISTHLRMLILPIVSVLVFGYMLIIKKIKFRYVIYFWGLILCEILLVYHIKDIFVADQYTAKNLEFQTESIVRSNINDSIAVRFSVLKEIVSLNFWKKFFYSVLGKVFYLGCASFFSVIFGFKYIVINIIQSIKKLINTKKQDDKWIGVWIYILFSVLGALSLDAMTLMYAPRYDQLFYGRYVENTVAIVIFFGVLQIVDHGVKVKEILICVICNLISAILLCLWIKQNNYSGTLPLQCAGVAGLFQKENWDFTNQFTIYAILMVILIFSVWLYLINKRRNLGIIVLGIIWTIIAYRGLELYIYPEISRMEAVIDIAEDIDSRNEKVWTLIPDDTDTNITAFVDVMWLQFQLDERTVYVLDARQKNELGKDDILVLSKAFPNVQDIIQNFEILFENKQMFVLKTQ